MTKSDDCEEVSTGALYYAGMAFSIIQVFLHSLGSSFVSQPIWEIVHLFAHIKQNIKEGVLSVFKSNLNKAKPHSLFSTINNTNY